MISTLHFNAALDSSRYSIKKFFFLHIQNYLILMEIDPVERNWLVYIDIFNY